MSSIAIRHDLRDRFGPARDQGIRPTCLAFAMSDAHAAALGPWTPLCSEYLFYHAKKREQTPPDTGATVSAIRAAVESDGQPVESDWPYLTDVPDDLTQWIPPANVGQIFCRSSQLIGNDFDDVWNAVADGKPVLIGMSVSDAFYIPNRAGIVDSNEPVDPARRHAVLVVAAGERSRKRFLLVRNSWGADWGLTGYAWLAKRYLAARAMIVVTVN